MFCKNMSHKLNDNLQPEGDKSGWALSNRIKNLYRSELLNSKMFYWGDQLIKYIYTVR